MQDYKQNPSQQTPSSFPNGKEHKGDSLSQQERDGAGLLLAPNGEPSNLSPVLYAYVRTTEFKNWFGDWEKGLHIMQNNDSYYRGQYEEPLIDERGNLILKGKKDSLYIKAGYDIEEGVSATTDMSSAEEYGVNQRYAYEADVEDKYGELDQSWEKEQELNDIAEHGYYLIQFPQNIFNQIINEAGEVKIVGDVIIPKGQYVIEHITDDDRKIIATANDNTTKIIDENGEPLVLYRGQMSHADVPFVNHGDGIYFTPQRKAAIGYGIDHDPIPVFLNAHNPYEVDFEGDSDIEETDNHADIKSEYHYARENDFDILIATNTFDGENDLDQYVVHDDAQIKRIDTLNPKQIIANVLKEDLQNNGISVDNDILRNYYGLSHLVVSQNKNIVTLNQIVAAQQNVGNGSQFMRDLIDLADKNAWTLALTPDTSLGATSANRLKNFYRQFGFADNKGKNADFNTKESMIRNPLDDHNKKDDMSYHLNNLIKNPQTSPSQNDIALRDKLVSLMQNAGIAVNTDWKQGQAVIDAAESQIKLMAQKGNKKTTTRERGGAVAGNPSSDSLNFDTKERLSRHPFGVQNLDAKILQNTEITKSRIKKIINQGDFSVKSQNPSEITRHINKRLRLDKSKSSQSYYGDYYEGDFNIGEERTARVRLSTHPATGERLGNAPTDDKISLVVYKNGEHHTSGQGYGEYSEWIYDPQKMSGEQIARHIIDGMDNLLNNGEYIDPSITPVIYPSTETRNIIEQAKTDGTYLKAPNGKETTLQEKQWAQVRTDAFKTWFGDWQNTVKFTACNVDDVDSLKRKYPSPLPNRYYHHSTNKYGLQPFDPREGKKERLHIIGRLTTDKVDCLVVENHNSNNAIPHITLATADGVKPVESNTELAKHQDKIQPLDDYVDTTFKNVLSRNVPKLLDKNGEPMVLYHGTNAEFNTFEQQEGLRWHGWGEQFTVNAKGFFFSDNYDDAKKHAHSNAFMKGGEEIVMPVYVSMKKPADLSELTNESEELFYDLTGYYPLEHPDYHRRDQWWRIVEDEEFDIPAKLKELGYDGIIFAEKVNEYTDITEEKSYYVTNPNQIKSATLNNGEFSLNNNDIRFQLADSSSLSLPTQQPIFISNALLALQQIQQQKATPQQWLGMLKNLNGIKPGEDRWTGLSDWLTNNTEKVLTKQQVLDYIAQNQIVVEETHYQNLEDNPRFKELYKEYLDEIKNVNDLYWEAKDNYDDFYDRMVEKYGQNFDIESDLTEEERREEEELFNEKDGYDTYEISAEEQAFQLMVDKYGEKFESAFSHDGDMLIIENDEDAGIFLYDDKVKPIHDTRLQYTTQELDNKHEIALTVPTIESWNENDEIHFGDADNGHAIAWIRFGETTISQKVSEEEIQRRIDNMPKAEEWEKVDGSNFVNKHDVYFFPGTRNKMGHSYIWDDNKGHFSIEGPMARKMLGIKFDSLQEAVNAYNRQWVKINNSTTNEKVLVIDEIQSKRHQEGREKGYKKTVTKEQKEALNKARRNQRVAARMFDNYSLVLQGKYGTLKKYIKPEELTHHEHRGLERWMRNLTDNEREEYNKRKKQMLDASETLVKVEGDIRNLRNEDGIPDAPFEKNWHELAMKRMLRYAAENGYDRVAWTTGEQQAVRYNIGNVIDKIVVGEKRSADDLNYHFGDDKIQQDAKLVTLMVKGSDNTLSLAVDDDGKIIYCHETEAMDNKKLEQLIGKKLAEDVLKADNQTFSTDDIKVGMEGMTAFYDQMLPNFINKYTKKWNTHTEDVQIPNIEDWGIKTTLHSVSVTPQMKQDVIQGQPMFYLTSQGDAYGFTHNNTIYIDPRIATSETPIHEYAHLWAQAMRQYNPEEWQNIVNLMKQEKTVWQMVKSQYTHLSSDSDIAEEVLAQYSGRQGMERLKKALQDYDGNIDDKQAQNILERIKVAIDRFWQKTADFLHIHYNSADEVAERVMHDLLHQVNPQALAQQTRHTNVPYVAVAQQQNDQTTQQTRQSPSQPVPLAAHVRVDFQSPSQTPAQAPADLQSVGNKVGDLQSHNQSPTQSHPILAYSSAPYLDVQSLAHGVKDGDTEAIKKAAARMADVVNVIPDKQNLVLVPMPSHNGNATYTKTLAEEVAKLTGLTTADFLSAQPHQPLYDFKKENGLQNIPVPSFNIKEDLPNGKTPLIIDNVLDTGTTAYAAAHAFGPDTNARVAVLGNTDNFYHFHNGIVLESEKLLNPVTYDNQGNVIPLSQRFNAQSADIHFQLVGQQGAAQLDATDHKGRIENLHVAQQMERADRTPKEIKIATGWERGADRKWRYEMPDTYLNQDTMLVKYADLKAEFIQLNDMGLHERNEEKKQRIFRKADKIRQKYIHMDIAENAEKTVGEAIDPNSEILRAYPEMANVNLKVINETTITLHGYYDEKGNTIMLNFGYLKSQDEVRSTLLHEMQHFIQAKEGFAQGANTDQHIPDVVIRDVKNNIEELQRGIENKQKTLDDIHEHLPEMRQLLDQVKVAFKTHGVGSPEIIKAMQDVKEFRSLHEEKFNLAQQLNFEIDDDNKKIESLQKYLKDNVLGYDEYKKMAGEVEARNVQSRMLRNPAINARTTAESTEDVPRSQQTVIFSNGTTSQQADVPPDVPSQRHKEQPQAADNDIVITTDNTLKNEILQKEIHKDEDNPHVGYSQTISDGGQKGKEHLSKTIFYDGKEIGMQTADLETGEANPFRLLREDAYKEHFFLDAFVSPYDLQKDKWEGIDGKELDGYYDYGCMVFNDLQQMVDFYEAHKQLIDYRNERSLLIENTAKEDRKSAEEISLMLPVNPNPDELTKYASQLTQLSQKADVQNAIPSAVPSQQQNLSPADVPSVATSQQQNVQQQNDKPSKPSNMPNQTPQHDYVQEFLDTKSKLQAAKADMNLSKLVRFEMPDGSRQVMTNAAYIQYALDHNLTVAATQEKGNIPDSKVQQINRAFNSANENIVKRDLGSYYSPTPEMKAYEQLLSKRFTGSKEDKPSNQEYIKARDAAIDSIIDANTPTKMYYHVKIDNDGTTMPISKTMYDFADFIQKSQAAEQAQSAVPSVAATQQQNEQQQAEQQQNAAQQPQATQPMASIDTIASIDQTTDQNASQQATVPPSQNDQNAVPSVAVTQQQSPDQTANTNSIPADYTQKEQDLLDMMHIANKTEIALNDVYTVTLSDNQLSLVTKDDKQLFPEVTPIQGLEQIAREFAVDAASQKLADQTKQWLMDTMNDAGIKVFDILQNGQPVTFDISHDDIQLQIGLTGPNTHINELPLKETVQRLVDATNKVDDFYLKANRNERLADAIEIYENFAKVSNDLPDNTLSKQANDNLVMFKNAVSPDDFMNWANAYGKLDENKRDEVNEFFYSDKYEKAAQELSTIILIWKSERGASAIESFAQETAEIKQKTQEDENTMKEVMEMRSKVSDLMAEYMMMPNGLANVSFSPIEVHPFALDKKDEDRNYAEEMDGLHRSKDGSLQTTHDNVVLNSLSEYTPQEQLAMLSRALESIENYINQDYDMKKQQEDKAFGNKWQQENDEEEWDDDMTEQVMEEIMRGPIEEYIKEVAKDYLINTVVFGKNFSDIVGPETEVTLDNGQSHQMTAIRYNYETGEFLLMNENGVFANAQDADREDIEKFLDKTIDLDDRISAQNQILEYLNEHNADLLVGPDVMTTLDDGQQFNIQAVTYDENYKKYLMVNFENGDVEDMAKANIDDVQRFVADALDWIQQNKTEDQLRQQVYDLLLEKGHNSKIDLGEKYGGAQLYIDSYSNKLYVGDDTNNKQIDSFKMEQRLDMLQNAADMLTADKTRMVQQNDGNTVKTDMAQQEADNHISMAHENLAQEMRTYGLAKVELPWGDTIERQRSNVVIHGHDVDGSPKDSLYSSLNDAQQSAIYNHVAEIISQMDQKVAADRMKLAATMEGLNINAVGVDTVATLYNVPDAKERRDIVVNSLKIDDKGEFHVVTDENEQYPLQAIHFTDMKRLVEEATMTANDLKQSNTQETEQQTMNTMDGNVPNQENNENKTLTPKETYDLERYNNEEYYDNALLAAREHVENAFPNSFISLSDPMSHDDTLSVIIDGEDTHIAPMVVNPDDDESKIQSFAFVDRDTYDTDNKDALQLAKEYKEQFPDKIMVGEDDYGFFNIKDAIEFKKLVDLLPEVHKLNELEQQAQAALPFANPQWERDNKEQIEGAKLLLYGSDSGIRAEYLEMVPYNGNKGELVFAVEKDINAQNIESLTDIYAKQHPELIPYNNGWDDLTVKFNDVRFALQFQAFVQELVNAEPKLSEAQTQNMEDVKERYPDALILNRNGDKYEAYGKDAKQLSSLLEFPTNYDRGFAVTQFNAKDLHEVLPQLIAFDQHVSVIDNKELSIRTQANVMNEIGKQLIEMMGEGHHSLIGHPPTEQLPGFHLDTKSDAGYMKITSLDLSQDKVPTVALKADEIGTSVSLLLLPLDQQQNLLQYAKALNAYQSLQQSVDGQMSQQTQNSQPIASNDKTASQSLLQQAEEFQKATGIQLEVQGNRLVYNDNLNLGGSSIKVLPDNLTVNGYLWLNGTNIERLPENLIVSETLDLGGASIKELPNNLKADSILLDYSNIEQLHEGLSIKSDLILNNSSIKTLPNNLSVDGSLNLIETPITELPDNLTVGGKLWLNGTTIETLPADLKVKDAIYMDDRTIEATPDVMSPDGYIDLVKAGAPIQQASPNADQNLAQTPADLHAQVDLQSDRNEVGDLQSPTQNADANVSQQTTMPPTQNDQSDVPSVAVTQQQNVQSAQQAQGEQPLPYIDKAKQNLKELLQLQNDEEMPYVHVKNDETAEVVIKLDNNELMVSDYSKLWMSATEAKLDSYPVEEQTDMVEDAILTIVEGHRQTLEAMDDILYNHKQWSEEIADKIEDLHDPERIGWPVEYVKDIIQLEDEIIKQESDKLMQAMEQRNMTSIEIDGETFSVNKKDDGIEIQSDVVAFGKHVKLNEVNPIKKLETIEEILSATEKISLEQKNNQQADQQSGQTDVPSVAATQQQNLSLTEQQSPELYASIQTLKDLLTVNAKPEDWPSVDVSNNTALQLIKVGKEDAYIDVIYDYGTSPIENIPLDEHSPNEQEKLVNQGIEKIVDTYERNLSDMMALMAQNYRLSANDERTISATIDGDGLSPTEHVDAIIKLQNSIVEKEKNNLSQMMTEANVYNVETNSFSVTNGDSGVVFKDRMMPEELSFEKMAPMYQLKEIETAIDKINDISLQKAMQEDKQDLSDIMMANKRAGKDTEISISNEQYVFLDKDNNISVGIKGSTDKTELLNSLPSERQREIISEAITNADDEALIKEWANKEELPVTFDPLKNIRACFKEWDIMSLPVKFEFDNRKFMDVDGFVRTPYLDFSDKGNHRPETVIAPIAVEYQKPTDTLLLHGVNVNGENLTIPLKPINHRNEQKYAYEVLGEQLDKPMQEAVQHAFKAHYYADNAVRYKELTTDFIHGVTNSDFLANNGNRVHVGKYDAENKQLFVTETNDAGHTLNETWMDAMKVAKMIADKEVVAVLKNNLMDPSLSFPALEEVRAKRTEEQNTPEAKLSEKYLNTVFSYQGNDYDEKAVVIGVAQESPREWNPTGVELRANSISGAYFTIVPDGPDNKFVQTGSKIEGIIMEIEKMGFIDREKNIPYNLMDPISYIHDDGRHRGPEQTKFEELMVDFGPNHFYFQRTLSGPDEGKYHASYEIEKLNHGTKEKVVDADIDMVYDKMRHFLLHYDLRENQSHSIEDTENMVKNITKNALDQMVTLDRKIYNVPTGDSEMADDPQNPVMDVSTIEVIRDGKIILHGNGGPATLDSLDSLARFEVMRRTINDMMDQNLDLPVKLDMVHQLYQDKTSLDIIKPFEFQQALYDKEDRLQRVGAVVIEDNKQVSLFHDTADAFSYVRNPEQYAKNANNFRMDLEDLTPGAQRIVLDGILNYRHNEKLQTQNYKEIQQLDEQRFKEQAPSQTRYTQQSEQKADVPYVAVSQQQNEQTITAAHAPSDLQSDRSDIRDLQSPSQNAVPSHNTQPIASNDATPSNDQSAKIDNLSFSNNMSNKKSDVIMRPDEQKQQEQPKAEQQQKTEKQQAVNPAREQAADLIRSAVGENNKVKLADNERISLETKKGATVNVESVTIGKNNNISVNGEIDGKRQNVQASRLTDDSLSKLATHLDDLRIAKQAVTADKPVEQKADAKVEQKPAQEQKPAEQKPEQQAQTAPKQETPAEIKPKAIDKVIEVANNAKVADGEEKLTVVRRDNPGNTYFQAFGEDAKKIADVLKKLDDVDKKEPKMIQTEVNTNLPGISVSQKDMLKVEQALKDLHIPYNVVDMQGQQAKVSTPGPERAEKPKAEQANTQEQKPTKEQKPEAKAEREVQPIEIKPESKVQVNVVPNKVLDHVYDIQLYLDGQKQGRGHHLSIEDRKEFFNQKTPDEKTAFAASLLPKYFEKELAGQKLPENIERYRPDNKQSQTAEQKPTQEQKPAKEQKPTEQKPEAKAEREVKPIELKPDSKVQVNVVPNKVLDHVYDIQLYLDGQKQGRGHHLSIEDRKEFFNQKTPDEKTAFAASLLPKYFEKELAGQKLPDNIERYRPDNKQSQTAEQKPAQEQKPAKEQKPTEQKPEDKTEQKTGQEQKPIQQNTPRINPDKVAEVHKNASEDNKTTFVQRPGNDNKPFYQTFGADAAKVAQILNKPTNSLDSEKNAGLAYINVSQKEMPNVMKSLKEQGDQVKVVGMDGKYARVLPEPQAKSQSNANDLSKYNVPEDKKVTDVRVWQHQGQPYMNGKVDGVKLPERKISNDDFKAFKGQKATPENLVGKYYSPTDMQPKQETKQSKGMSR